jgi:hypothetical protein
MPKSSAPDATPHLGFRALRRAMSLLAKAAAHFRPLEHVPVGFYLHELCAPSLERLRLARKRLKPETARAEKEFLAFGEGLQRLAANCDEIVRQGEDLLKVAAGDEGHGAIQAVRELLDRPLGFVSDFAFDSAGLRSNAERIQATVSRILLAEEELFTALKPLVHLRTSFHIESARLTNEIFGSMDEEIEALQNALQTQFSAKFSELRTLRMALTGFADEYTRRGTALADRVGKERATLLESFDKMDLRVADSCRLQTSLLDATGGLSQEVGIMVVAMQTHDTVVQRLAHANRGLEVLSNKFALLESGTLGDSRRGLANIAAIATLETAQVHSAREQLLQASLALLANVDGVVASVRRFDEDCIMMREFGQASAGVHGTVQILLDGIDETCQLVHETADAARACAKPMQPLEALVGSLSQDIAATGEQMHRLALNFQLAASRYGQGTGLEVLAERMAATSQDVSRICAVADQEVRTLAGDLRQTLDGFANIVAQSDCMRSLFGGNESQGLHEFRDATLGAFQKVGEFVDNARQTAAHMQAVDFQRMCEEILPEIETSAGDFAVLAQQLCETLGAHELHAEELRALKSQYTMHAERMVHDGCLGDVSQQENSDQPELVVAGSDLGDNVELF